MGAGDKNSGVEMRAQEHGGALRTGNPGNAGGPGRPAADEIDFFKELARSAGGRQQLREIIADKNHKHFAKLYVYVWDRVLGRTRQSVEVQTMPAPVIGPLDGVAHYYVDEFGRPLNPKGNVPPVVAGVPRPAVLGDGLGGEQHYRVAP